MFGLQAVTVVTISAAFVFGMVLALLGSLKLALAKRIHLGEGRIGFLLSVLNIALMPMMIFTGLLIDVPVNPRWIILGASSLTAIAIVVLSYRPNYPATIVAVLLAGLGSAGLSTVSIVLMRQAFWPDSPMASLNMGNVFFALGALITPVLVDVLLSFWSFRRVGIVIALICLLPAVFAAMTSTAALKVDAVHTESASLASSPALWLAALVFAFYAPLEASISIWATTFLTEMRYGERGATWTLSGFWCAFLGSRVLMALAAHTGYLAGWEPWFLVIPALLAAALLGNLAGTASPAMARRGLFAIGFLLGPIFPTLIGILFQQLKKEQMEVYGTAYGMVLAAGSLGSLILAPVIGLYARQRNVQVALRVPMLLAIVMTLVAVVFSLVKD
jgi:fucose permease